jgi:hypothetical protein
MEREKKWEGSEEKEGIQILYELSTFTHDSSNAQYHCNVFKGNFDVLYN